MAWSCGHRPPKLQLKISKNLSAQRCVLRVQLRRDPRLLGDPGLVVQRIIADPAPVVQHPHMWVADQLVRVAVAGDEEDALDGAE